ncbi:MAG: HD domain-containing protein [Cellulomonadaceae bacterium]|nr:HD domain-containing protein [Cellulomonadaceae bacterium]
MTGLLRALYDDATQGAADRTGGVGGAEGPGVTEGLALAAVGSLARGDIGPASDLDLVLLHDGRSRSYGDVAAIANKLWYPLWDSGVTLDHSVRSIAETRLVAKADLPAVVGWLDVAPIAGDAGLVQSVAGQVLADWRAAIRKRLPELLADAASRAARVGDLAYLIEPDLKEARGGLRDAVVLDALAAAWLTDRPRGPVDQARNFLLDVRDELQRVTHRRSNRLLLADLDDVAAHLGFDTDPDDLLAAVANAGRHIAYALDVAGRQARAAGGAESGRPGAAFRSTFIVRGRRSAPRLPAVAEGFVNADGEIVLAAGFDPAADPCASLRAAAASATSGLPISPVTVTALAACPPLPQPWPAQARDHLLTLLASGRAQIPVWEALDLAGIVTRWIPEWAGVRNKPQRAAFHRHTVDRHLIEVAAQAAELLPGGPHSVTPDGSDHPLARWDVILLAALLHDIGKRRQASDSDHSIDGARIAPVILERMGFDEDVIADVARLIRNHLRLADLATRCDPGDPVVVEQLLVAVDHRRDLLAELRILTQADSASLREAGAPSIGSGAAGWTPWRASLVNTLTSSALAALT